MYKLLHGQKLVRVSNPDTSFSPIARALPSHYKNQTRTWRKRLEKSTGPFSTFPKSQTSRVIRNIKSENEKGSTNPGLNPGLAIQQALVRPSTRSFVNVPQTSFPDNLGKKNGKMERKRDKATTHTDRFCLEEREHCTNVRGTDRYEEWESDKRKRETVRERGEREKVWEIERSREKEKEKERKGERRGERRTWSLAKLQKYWWNI